ncbi:hemerythrin domain-containing protein [Pelagibius sp.]|uniref:hemerythrin domain-containing protein n=1 Tax=Pelagibius sp. TaxID=1931238 RepID=UPI00260D6B18|nr:hemerythrin domain-containing protein [Pelagibius sp.]
MTAEHDRLRFLAAALRLTQDGAPMQSMRPLLIDRLSDALEAHSSAAEQCFYAELLARTGNEQPARRAVEAHGEAALLVDELADMETTDAAWQTAVERLTGLFKAQFTQEAEEVIPLAKTLLDRERALRLGERYDDARRGWIEAFGRQPVPAPTIPAASLPASSGPNTETRTDRQALA